MTDPIAHVESQLQRIHQQMEKLHANIDRLVKEKEAMRAALEKIADLEGDYGDRAVHARAIARQAIALYGSTV